MILVSSDGRQEHPRPEPDPLTGAITSATNTTVSAATSASRRAIYKWQAQTTEAGSQFVTLKAGSTVIDGVVCANEAQGKICDSCWYEIEADEAIVITTTTAIDVRYFVWVVNI